MTTIRNYGQPINSFSDFYKLDNTDLLARLIYSEARGEIEDGKIAIAYIVHNRVLRNTDEFGGSTMKGVILKSPGGFQGMRTFSAMNPTKEPSAWKECLFVAENYLELKNPIDTRLWFLPTIIFHNLQNKCKSGSIYMSGECKDVVLPKPVGKSDRSHVVL